MIVRQSIIRISFIDFIRIKSMRRSAQPTKKRRNICRMAGQIFLLFLRVLRMGHTSKNAKCGHIPIKPWGYPKGAMPPFGTQPLEQRCSVLYLLPRLTGKRRVSHDGHTRFARQESGQVFANGNEQKACSVSESGSGYTVYLACPLLLFLHKSNS